jgi:hypothetical protein
MYYKRILDSFTEKKNYGDYATINMNRNEAPSPTIGTSSSRRVASSIATTRILRTGRRAVR